MVVSERDLDVRVLVFVKLRKPLQRTERIDLERYVIDNIRGSLEIALGDTKYNTDCAYIAAIPPNKIYKVRKRPEVESVYQSRIPNSVIDSWGNRYKVAARTYNRLLIRLTSSRSSTITRRVHGFAVEENRRRMFSASDC